MQNKSNNWTKPNVNDTYKKNEKPGTNFEPSNDEDLVNTAYLDMKSSKIEGQISYIEKDYNEFKLEYNKQSVEAILIRRAVKTTIQILYDKGLFDNFQKSDKVMKDFSFTTTRRPD